MSAAEPRTHKPPINPLARPEVQKALLAGRPVQKRWRHRVTDLSPLAGFTDLQALHLDVTGVMDLSPLAGLTALQTLSLNGTGVTDLSPLAGLTALQTLSLDRTAVTDLSPLAGLTRLQTLSLDETDVADLSPLAGLRALKTLSLDETDVADLSPLAGLSALKMLSLNRTRVTDLSPLAKFSELLALHLNRTKVADFSPLAGLRKLQTLHLDGTRVTDLSLFAGLTALRTLWLDETKVTDLSPLAGLAALQRLWLSETDVADLSPLAGLTALQLLWLDGTRVADISPLAGLTALQTLSLRGTGITDVSALEQLINLQIHIEETPLQEKSSVIVSALSKQTSSASEDTRRPTTPPLSDRVKLVFDDARWMQRALAVETPGFSPRVVSRRRNFLAVERLAGMGEDQFLAMVERLAKGGGGRLTPDFRYSLEDRPGFSPTHTLASDKAPAGGTLADVLAMIRADEGCMDNRSRGGDVAIAVVDTGVNGGRPEFPAWKRAGAWAPDGETAWTDGNGHGTMCATIAAATQAQGGAFRGVAPNAGLIACKTFFFSSELTDIYDMLADRARAGEVIVASNSFGIRSGVPPQPGDGHDLFEDALRDAIDAGVRVVFSAGNYHELAGGDAASCGPNSIWLQKGWADVITVATCDLERAMWPYSSRGPGQFPDAPGTGPKPDVTAPTPRNGVILFGDEVVVMPDGWGTSGAAPQVAGLLALLLSRRPGLPRDELFDLVRSTARPLDGFTQDCQGKGLIDCRTALDRLLGEA